MFRETLPAANIQAFRGVLNSTTNLILSRMESGDSYAAAVAYACAVRPFIKTRVQAGTGLNKKETS